MKLVAGLPDPKLTAVTPVKLVPVMVTVVPPVVGPVPGLTAVTVGGGRHEGEPVSGAGGARAPAGETVTSTMPAPSQARWR